MGTAIHEDALRRYRPYPGYKSSGVEWLGEIPEHWEVKRLRSTVKSCQNGVWGDEADGFQDIACVRVADFDRVSFRVNINDPTLRSIEPRVASERGLKQGDLLLEKSGGGENQPVGAVVLYDHGIPAVCSNFVARVVLAKGFNPRFMAYLHAALYSLRINTRYIKQSTGIQNLDSESYLNEAVGFPSETDEQHSIAIFLDRETARIDALVAKKQRLIELLQEKRIALITRAVTKGLDPTVPMKDSGVEWLGEIPEHWEIKPFTKYVKERADYRGKTPTKVTTGIFLVTARNIRMGWIDYECSQEFVAEDEYDEIMRRGLPRIDDILFTTEAPLGNVALVDREDIALAQRVIRFRVRPDIFFSQFALSAMMSGYFQAQLKTLSTGSTAEGLKASKLPMLWLVAPPIQEQQTISKGIQRETEKVGALIASIARAIARLEELRAALISAAVTGKIDVREEVL
ncbi:restriction endonuclease subunit S [Microcystis elabens FACHB-917]|nr:restriction endonuclease subunit S [Microcystis elabens FACHB-917]